MVTIANSETVSAQSVIEDAKVRARREVSAFSFTPLPGGDWLKTYDCSPHVFWFVLSLDGVEHSTTCEDTLRELLEAAK